MKLEIRWQPHFTDTEYGMVGEIKVFSIVDHCQEFTLWPRLPNRKGMTPMSESFRTREEAKARADHMLTAFLKDFLPKAPPAKPAAIGTTRKTS
ncbi:hypothetical protein ACIBEJ_31580 [Nonomuraea sp. NPDC050790]|uniref:hypothetical protein n=1 Tax=Nonomuraea sp. NPDC050790 TaxID=3364371 RepID=UPI0037B838B5